MLSCDNDSPMYVRNIANVDCLLLPSKGRIVLAMFPSLFSFYPEIFVVMLRGNEQKISMPPISAGWYVVGEKVPFR